MAEKDRLLAGKTGCWRNYSSKWKKGRACGGLGGTGRKYQKEMARLQLQQEPGVAGRKRLRVIRPAARDETGNRRRIPLAMSSPGVAVLSLMDPRKAGKILIPFLRKKARYLDSLGLK